MESWGHRIKGNRRSVRGDLVTLLGWIAAILAVEVSLSYLKKRWLITLLKFAESGKQQAVAALKRSLDYHCYLSLAGLGIAFLHSWNRLGEIRLNLSWLTLGMMAIVTVKF